MVSRISEWIELSFWQVAVRVLSGARPFSHSLQKVQESTATQTIRSVLAREWTIAAAGWILGLILGIWIATWI